MVAGGVVVEVAVGVMPNLIPCPDCDTAGCFLGPITCTGACDWCGGCCEELECTTCLGVGEIEDEDA